LVFSPDGGTIAIASLDQRIELADAADLASRSELLGHRGPVTSLAFAGAGHTLITGSTDGSVRVWDTVPPEPPKTRQELPPGATRKESRLSPDGQHLLTVFTNGTFSLWDTLHFVESPRYPLPLTNTTHWALAPGGALAAFGNPSGQLSIWDATAGRERCSLAATNAVGEMIFSLDGQQLASAGRNVCVWDIRGTQAQATHCWPGDSLVLVLKFSLDGRRLAMGSYSGKVKVWDLSNPSRERVFQGLPKCVQGLAFSPDGRTLATAGDGLEIRLWDVDSQRNTGEFTPRTIWFTDCTISPDGRTLAVADYNGLITLWNLASRQQVGTLNGHSAPIWQTGLAFTPDGNKLVSVSQEQYRVWRAAPLEEVGSERAR
jgi:WD40 repeat protein